jgi:large subunit ribosomal protein L5
MTHLGEHYKTVIQPNLKEQLKQENVHALPRLVKISINVGWGDLKGNEPLQKSVAEGLSLITGQKPVLTRAKRAIAGFKIRQNDVLGYKVTLRGQRMYDFLERVITYVLPRLRDFQGVPTTGFDHNGNFSFGLREQTVFPEIPFQGNEKTWGMQVTLVTSSNNKDEARLLLEQLGFPFAKSKEDK